VFIGLKKELKERSKEGKMEGNHKMREGIFYYYIRDIS